MLHKTMQVLIVLCLLAFELIICSEYADYEFEDDPTTSPVKPGKLLVATCPEEEVPTGFGTFVFPETATVKGTEIRVECPLGFKDDGIKHFDAAKTTMEEKKSSSGVTRTCKAIHSNNGPVYGKWEPASDEIQPKDCRDQATVSVEEALQRSLETVSVNNYRQIFPRLQIVMVLAMRDHSCATIFVNGIAYLLSTPKLHGEDGLNMDDKLRLFSLIDNFSSQLAEIMPNGSKYKVGDQGIIVETVKFYPSNLYVRLAPANSIGSKAFELMPYLTNLTASDDGTVGITISDEALELSLDQIHDAPKLKITVYKDDVFKVWKENHPVATTTVAPTLAEEGITTSLDSSSTDTPDENSTETFEIETWGLVDIELDGVIEDLAAPVEFRISDILPEGYGFSECVYWDKNESMWSTKGVSTTLLDRGNEVICKSTHLTAFSALIEPLPLPFPDAEYAPINNSVHAYILSILSSIGSVCSIIGLGLTVLTYTLFRSLRRERSNRILLNLSSSLLLMHIMSISGSKSLWDGHCFVPAASLHYLVLTSLAWMMVEAVHMFELLISVFVRPENQFLLKRCVLAWGIPMIMVITSTIVDPVVYKAGRADLCLMNAHKNIILYYVAYIAPICIMLLVNLIVFCKIFRVLYQQTKRTRGKSVNSKGSISKYQFVKISPSQIKGATTVLVLLGIGWIFGLLAIGPFEVFFRYLYCVCNAGQGAFIFIFRVILNPHACKQWKRIILGFSGDGSLDVSVTTSSTTGSASGNKRKSTMLSPTFISAANSVENSLTPSNPLSNTLATTLASIIRSEDERAAKGTMNLNQCNRDVITKEM